MLWYKKGSVTSSQSSHWQKKQVILRHFERVAIILFVCLQLNSISETNETKPLDGTFTSLLTSCVYPVFVQCRSTNCTLLEIWQRSSVICFQISAFVSQITKGSWAAGQENNLLRSQVGILLSWFWMLTNSTLGRKRYTGIWQYSRAAKVYPWFTNTSDVTFFSAKRRIF